MKYKIVILFLLLTTALSADELQRIESIVNDITILREKYESVEQKYELCSVSLRDEREKNAILTQELEQEPSFAEKERAYQKEISALKEKIEKMLTPKEKPQKKAKIAEAQGSDSEIEYFKARSFRLKRNAPIYDAIDGDVIDVWDENTSFTSNQMSREWIKITGHFVDKIWQRSKSEMWLQKEDYKEREAK